MSNHHKHLPLEIWTNVFKYVDKPKDVCQCRLVCKNWDYIAESALFTKELCLTGIENANKMSKHPAKKPMRARLIKHLDLKGIIGNEPEVQLLLREAFTTTMEFLAAEGELSSMHPDFFATLIDIVKNAPPNSRFSLQKMAYSQSSRLDENYARAAYAFRDTLQNLGAPIDSPAMQSILGNLKAFKQLRYLELHGDSITTLDDLESILRHCERLEDLKLWINHVDIPQQTTTTTVTNWINTHVQQVGHAISLETDITHPMVIQYLAYKYSKSDYFRCAGSFYQEGEISHLLSVVKNMEHFNTQIYIEDFEELRMLLVDFSHLDNTTTNLVVSIDSTVLNSTDLAAEVEITIENNLSRTIKLDIGFEWPKGLDFLALLSYLGEYSADCNLTDLKLDTMYCGSTETKEEVAIYAIDIIDRLPTWNKMFLAIDKLQYKPCEANEDHTNWTLDSLGIHNTTIDSRALTQISQFSPQLKSITFCNCSIVNKDQAQQKLFEIDMPQSSLETMDIQDVTSWDPLLCKKNVSTTSDIVRCYMEINLLHQDVQIYLLYSPELNVVVPTWGAFESLPHKDTYANIKITVADLKQLKLSFDHIRTVFDVEKYVAIDQVRKEGLKHLKHTLALENVTAIEDLVKDVKKIHDKFATRVWSLMGDVKDLNSAVLYNLAGHPYLI